MNVLALNIISKDRYVDLHNITQGIGKYSYLSVKPGWLEGSTEDLVLDRQRNRVNHQLL